MSGYKIHCFLCGAFFLTIYTYSYPSIFIMNLHEWDDLRIFLFLLAHFGQCGFGLRELMMAYKYASAYAGQMRQLHHSWRPTTRWSCVIVVEFQTWQRTRQRGAKGAPAHLILWDFWDRLDQGRGEHYRGIPEKQMECDVHPGEGHQTPLPDCEHCDPWSWSSDVEQDRTPLQM